MSRGQHNDTHCMQGECAKRGLVERLQTRVRAWHVLACYLPAVTEALAATPGVASSAGKIPPFWQIPQSACSVTRGYGFHTVEV